ncbi:head GIN domain-containing protein [Dysgonomonas sp. 511]|uniref:head GIN domain-containing protein n=1 Tax=Dysgonomonas sp. 511 TaxID=2302930 RepID=UPI0013D0C07F|nr:head GIN domain-containing protein [Dysgonomonas sp. 511]NDV78923.1 DUF2807 domain-containing protein [Dysgonomonas sp. 511]
MKTFFFTISIMALVLATQSCNIQRVKGNGTIVEKEVAISDFDKMSFSGGATIYYEQKKDEAPYLKIEIDENLFPLLEIESKGNSLSIGSGKESINPTKYNIYTNSKDLSEMKGSGSVKLFIKGALETEKLAIKISGSGDVKIDSISARSLESRASGSSHIIVAGRVNSFGSTISGSGKTDAYDLLADTVKCKVSGSGKFFVHADSLLDVSISGSGKVNYKGKPEIKKSISGSGKVIDNN